MNAILGVGGGIAAYKSAELARALMERGLRVQAILTRAAQQFITPLTFAALTGTKSLPICSRRELGGNPFERHGAHRRRPGKRCDGGRARHGGSHGASLAHGHADDFLTTCYLAFTGHVVIAPAMNTNMWIHPATQENVRDSRQRGHVIVEPEDGCSRAAPPAPAGWPSPNESQPIVASIGMHR